MAIPLFKTEHMFDFLVIGGGVAGLTFAINAAPFGRVAVLFKSQVADSSTAWAQGGIAAAAESGGDIELHLADTLTVGAGLSDPLIARMVVTEGPARIIDLIAQGVKFDTETEGGKFHLHQEGGHSARRIFHSSDATGAEIQRALLQECNAQSAIEFFPFTHAIDLITTHKLGLTDTANRAVGAYVLMADGQVLPFLADKTLLATGGAGKVYLYTSNPDIATGDGVAMGYRAGTRVANMEFFQFHPTCLYHPHAKSFLITEAMRGEGAILKRIDGTRFMPSYHPLAELGPRDVVARAIDHEMKSTGDDYVLLDISHRGPEFIRSHFPNIYARCLSLGIDCTTEPIPVVPAAHFSCGGIIVDEHGRTDVPNLYAAGECTHTGLHGANRLASNSLLEGVVFGFRSAKHASANLDKQSLCGLAARIPAWDFGSAIESEERVIISQNWDEIRRFMWNYVGVVRSDRRLQRALNRIQLIQREISEYYWNFLLTPDLLELRNLSLVAELVIRSAISRKESRGLHHTIDYPESSAEFSRDTVLAPSNFLASESPITTK